MKVESVIERELKLRLPDEETWLSLCTALGEPTQVFRQLNTYFDTGTRQLSSEQKVMVRVRESAGRVELTVKDRVERDIGSGHQSVRERNYELDSADWADVVANRIELCALENELSQSLRTTFGSLVSIGRMINTRRVYPLSDGYLAEVDRTEFSSGRVDYEVEVELRRDGHTYEAARHALCESLDLELVDALMPSSPKYARFLESLERD